MSMLTHHVTWIFQTMTRSPGHKEYSPAPYTFRSIPDPSLQGMTESTGTGQGQYLQFIILIPVML